MRPWRGLWWLVALPLSGCFTAGYLRQAAAGQYELLHRAEPISRVRADPAVPARTRALLSSVERIKAFGRAQGLTATRSYGRYTALDRAAAVWVVQGCAPLAFEVRRWWFPLVGSVPYLGFFDEGEARRYAEALEREERLDVAVRGAAAYSTLGWFPDPVLSTMLGEGDTALGELADVVLHESVHATLFLRDQTAFDESLASFVADRLAAEWLASARGPLASETRAWRLAQWRGRARIARLHQTYLELDALYRSAASDEAKRAQKARLLRAVEAELRLSRPLNNASLAGYQTYDRGAEAFERLFHACGERWPRVLGALQTLRAEDFERPQQEDFDGVVDALASRACR